MCEVMETIVYVEIGIVGIVVLYLLVKGLPDFVRYMKIKSM